MGVTSFNMNFFVIMLIFICFIIIIIIIIIISLFSDTRSVVSYKKNGT